MFIEQKSSAFKIINDFSRQLFLIKTPSNFNKGLNDAFQDVLPDIKKYAYFRYHWADGTFSIISSNYLKHIDDIHLEKSRLSELLIKFL